MTQPITLKSDKSLKIISQWNNQSFPNFIIPVRPHNFDVRINLQRSCFTFHVPKQQEISLDANPSLHTFHIPATAKPAIRTELKMLGIDAFGIYGDLEHLSATLKAAHFVVATSPAPLT